jgi:transcriptional regulator with XRE-family HTH domain
VIALTSSRQARQFLRAAREYQGVSRRQLSKRLHLGHNAVAKREKDNGNMGIEAFAEHAAALGYRVVLLRDRDGSTGTGWPA